MKRFKKFIAWTLSSGRKLPLHPLTLQVTDQTHNPDLWVSYDEVRSERKAFVVHEGDPFFFVDIDNCLQSDNTWSPLAIELCNMFAGAYIEVSQSGTGLHIIGSTTAIPAHTCKNIALGIELYTSSRFIALGYPGNGDITSDHTAALAALADRYFKPIERIIDIGDEWTDGPCAEWRGPTDDADLIRRAMRSMSTAAAFGSKATFAQLWEGDTEALGRVFPHTSKAYDESSADMALACHLAFWTGRDCERMHRLMFMSNLVRDKWDRDDYIRDRTIMGACRTTDRVCQDKQADAATSPTTASSGARLVSGHVFVSIEQQLELFKGFAYVTDSHSIFDPNYGLRGPDRFNATFGGYRYNLDAVNDKIAKSPWQAFVESEAIRHVKVHSTCFRPDLPTGAVVDIEGWSFVNSYITPRIKLVRGDASPFMRHLEKLLPHQRDREILLAYLAALVQHQGTKFAWAPVIQGVEGNGKTIISSCAAHAIGSMYTHWASVTDLENRFNSWLYGRVLICVEDLFKAGDEIHEHLKPMITGTMQQIQGKGADQVSRSVCANFIFNCNDQASAAKTRDGRRYCPLFTAQQSVDDMRRDGMLDGHYFNRLRRWLVAEDGYAIVAEFLRSYPIPDELNPAKLADRAPETSSTERAIVAGLGRVEQEIQEAIDMGRIGFRGDWVSSHFLDQLLDEVGASKSIPRNKRRDLLRSLGYVQHPALKDGRVDNPIFPDGTRSRLYVKAASPAVGYARAEATRAYSVAQDEAVRV